MTNFENKGRGGLISPEDTRDYQLNDLIAAAGSTELPLEYINPHVSEITVLDQGSSSTCVACSLAYLKWLCEYDQSNNRELFSPSYIYGNRDINEWRGEGMYPRQALGQLKKFGVCSYNDFPGFYDVNTSINLYRQKKNDLDPKAHPFRISSYYKVSNIADIKKAIYSLGAVTASFPVYYCLYQPDEKGNINYDASMRGAAVENHEMTIVGWTKDNKWIVLNSWGNAYGDNGKCYLPFNYPFNEVWAVMDYVTEVMYKMARFLDTEGHWAEQSIDKAADMSIVKGFEDGTFKPDEPITRAQLCAILDRLHLLN